MACMDVDLLCSVCRGFFPLLLSCGHSFCHSCLEKICSEQGEEEKWCPLCRRRISNNLLPPNMALQKDTVHLHHADLRIVLVGKTGSGKSAAGNTILGRESFKYDMSPESVTKKCQLDEVMSGEMTISVTDTPGVYGTDLGEKALRRELKSCIHMTTPGPHVFLLVIRVGVKYNRDEQDAVDWICDHFGTDTQQYVMVLFTHTDWLKGKTLDQYVSESSELKKLIRDCGGKFLGLNNNKIIPDQVPQLLQKIKSMVKRNKVNGREYYSNEMYDTAQKQIEDANTTLVLTTGAGAITAAAGGVVLGVTQLVILPGLMIGGGGVTAVVAGGILVKKIYDGHQKRKNK